MNFNSICKLLMVVLVLVVIAMAAVHMPAVPFKAKLGFADIAGLLGGIFIIVLLVERFTEIPVTIWFGVRRDRLNQTINSLRKQSAAEADEGQSKHQALQDAEKQLQQLQADTKSMALLFGLSAAVLACAAGVGILHSILDVSQAQPVEKQMLRGVDILLTAGLIAGGSDSFHQFVRMLEAFFTTSKNRLQQDR